MTTADPSPRPSMMALRPIGHVSSSLTDLALAPRQADEDAPSACLLLVDDVAAGLGGLRPGDRIVAITWLDRADRNAMVVHPRGDVRRPPVGVFATRSPHRPNPIGLHVATVLAVEGCALYVDGLEAIDGTPILDIKIELTPVEGR